MQKIVLNKKRDGARKLSKNMKGVLTQNSAGEPLPAPPWYSELPPIIPFSYYKVSAYNIPLCQLHMFDPEY